MAAARILLLYLFACFMAAAKRGQRKTARSQLVSKNCKGTRIPDSVSEHHIAVLCKGFGQIGGYGIVWLDQFRELVPQFRATSRICHTLPTNHHVIYIYILTPSVDKISLFDVFDTQLFGLKFNRHFG